MENRKNLEANDPVSPEGDLGSRNERIGFFCVDNEDSTSENLIFNRTATLRDNWSK